VKNKAKIDFSGIIPEEGEGSENNNGTISDRKMSYIENTSPLLDTQNLHQSQYGYKKSTSLVVKSKFKFGLGASPNKYGGS
jgi:hypothetical protein